MAGPTQLEYDAFIQTMAQRFDSSRQSRHLSRTSPIQSTRRHSARIEKPRSHQPSPRTPERRRIVNAPKHYSAMEDHYRRMMGLDEDDEQDDTVNQQYQTSIRPVSWHPGYQTPYTQSNGGNSSMYSSDPSPISQYLSYQNSPFHQTATHRASQPESAWSQYMHGNFNAAATHGHEDPDQRSMVSWFDNSDTQEEDSRIKSTWTQADEHEERFEREKSVELVGLGLYDEPGFTVKIGSKLEEECDPPEFDVDDEDNEESSEEEEEELPKPEDAKVAQASLPMMDMSGQSFFVGPDDGYKNNWWTNSESKQHPPQVNAVNYDWV